MQRSGRILGIAVFVCALLSGCRGAGDSPPNVLLITLDALRQDHLSLLGYERRTSPNIDWLGTNGVVFPNLIPSGCSTKASLTSLLTSIDYRSHQVLDHGGVLADGYTTLAEVFRSAGYRTAAFVATPMVTAKLNYAQGFETFEDFAGKKGRYVTADRVGARALAYLRASHDEERPLFAYLHFEEPHPPWTHPSEWLTSEESATQFFGCTHLPDPAELAAIDEQKRVSLIAKYDGAIRYADEWIGQLLGELRNSGRLDRTIVAISTDHGLELLDRGAATHGHNPFDEVVRGFMVLYDGRERIQAPHADRTQGRIFDIGPTLLGRAGIEAPGSLEGVDLMTQSERLPEFAFTKCYSAVSVRSRNFKLVYLDPDQRERWNRGIFHGRDPSNNHALFDLRNDPGETVDAKAALPEQYARMQAALTSYLEDLQTEHLPGTVLRDAELDDTTLERLRALGYVN